MSTNKVVVPKFLPYMAELRNPSKKMMEKLYMRSNVTPEKYPDAVTYKAGTFDLDVSPIARGLTDEMCLVASLMFQELTQLPAHITLVSAQYRHDLDLLPLLWAYNMPMTVSCSSKAGDAKVTDKETGKPVAVKGGAGNMTTRNAAGVYCNEREENGVMVVRCMPMLPYSETKAKFAYNRDNANLHSEGETDSRRLACAAKHFVMRMQEKDLPGLVVIKPTIGKEDAFFVGIIQKMLQELGINITKAYKRDFYAEMQDDIDHLFANHLPTDFMDGLNGEGEVECWIADFGYVEFSKKIILQQECVVITNDGDGDRVTDINATKIAEMELLVCKVLTHLNSDKNSYLVLKEIGYNIYTNQYDSTSVMYTMDGRQIFEISLGTAADLFLRLLDGEDVSYNLMSVFRSDFAAYLHENPYNSVLRSYANFFINGMENMYQKNPEIGVFAAFDYMQQNLLNYKTFG